ALTRVAQAEAASPSVVRELMALATIAEQCPDDAIKAEVALAVTSLDAPDAMTRAEAAVAAFPQVDLRADCERKRGYRSLRDQHWDDAWSRFERALDWYGGRHRVRSQLAVVRYEIQLLAERGSPGDPVALTSLLARWGPVARGIGGDAAASFERE